MSMPLLHHNATPSGSGTKEDDNPFSKAARPAVSPPCTLLFSGTSYCLASVLMVLANKYALAAFPGASSPTCLLFLQCGICAVLVGGSQLLGLVHCQRLNWRVVRAWFPSNVLFVLMLWTSVVSLRYLSVPMVTVLKSLSNVFTIVGDYIIFKRTYSAGVWWSLVLITLSSMAGGLTDLEFNAAGYAWQLLNCAVTAAYSLYIKKAMGDAAECNEDKEPLTENSMVLLNNALSLPMLVIMMAMTGELGVLSASVTNLASAKFAAVAIVSGIVSFGLSYSSLWFLSVSTPTSYSLVWCCVEGVLRPVCLTLNTCLTHKHQQQVGNLNKVPTAIGSYLIFHDRVLTSPPSLASLLLGVVGGLFFVTSKGKSNKQRAAANNGEPASAREELMAPVGDGNVQPLVMLPHKRRTTPRLVSIAVDGRGGTLMPSPSKGDMPSGMPVLRLTHSVRIDEA